MGIQMQVFLGLAAAEGTLMVLNPVPSSGHAVFVPKASPASGCSWLQLKTPPATSADLINSMFQLALDKVSVLSYHNIEFPAQVLIPQPGQGLTVSSDQPGEVSLLT